MKTRRKEIQSFESVPTRLFSNIRTEIIPIVTIEPQHPGAYPNALLPREKACSALLLCNFPFGKGMNPI